MVEILTVMSGDVSYDTSTKTTSNLAAFDKISKSGDGGGYSGGIIDTLMV